MKSSGRERVREALKTEELRRVKSSDSSNFQFPIERAIAVV